MKKSIATIQMIKRNGILVPVEKHTRLFAYFTSVLEDNQKVDVFLSSLEDDATSAQIAKIHVGLKQLAVELGYSFEEIKSEIKVRSGLKFLISETEVFERSFSECSKAEILLVFQAMNEAGESVGLYFT